MWITTRLSTPAIRWWISIRAIFRWRRSSARPARASPQPGDRAAAQRSHHGGRKQHQHQRRRSRRRQRGSGVSALPSAIANPPSRVSPKRRPTPPRPRPTWRATSCSSRTKKFRSRSSTRWPPPPRPRTPPWPPIAQPSQAAASTVEQRQAQLAQVKSPLVAIPDQCARATRHPTGECAIPAGQPANRRRPWWSRPS